MEKVFKWNEKEYSDEDLKERFNGLGKKREWDKECRICRYPKLLHDRDKPCLKPSAMDKTATDGWKADLWETWSEFKARMDVIVSEYEDEMERNREKFEEELEAYRQDREEMHERQASNEFLIGIKQMSDAISGAMTKGNENLIRQLQGRPNK